MTTTTGDQSKWAKRRRSARAASTRYVSRPESRSDLAQTVMLQSWKAGTSIQHDAYIGCAVRRAAANRLREQSAEKRGAGAKTLSLIDEPGGSGPSPEELSAMRDEIAVLRAEMDPQHFDALVLTTVYGYTRAQLAVTLDCTRSKASGIVSRAKQEARKILEGLC